MQARFCFSNNKNPYFAPLDELQQIRSMGYGVRYRGIVQFTVSKCFAMARAMVSS
jgi:hypothetical protein